MSLPNLEREDLDRVDLAVIGGDGDVKGAFGGGGADESAGDGFALASGVS